jgi:hypothetical protein
LFKAAPLAVADAVRGDHHQRGWRDLLPVAFVGPLKPERVEPGQDALVVDQLAVNRDLMGIGGHIGDFERIANPEAKPERVGENDLHGGKILLSNDECLRKPEERNPNVEAKFQAVTSMRKTAAVSNR